MYSLNRLVSLAAKYQIKNGCNRDDLCFKPGTDWGYSNTNYIIEKYFKKSYGSMLETLIIKPLKKQYGVPIHYAM
ncbi:beta-lactamase family protein [Thiotrichales bacterium 19S3-11]|nr:beta-lactamase family protein [Thiotrichales bacterium 19S3-11]